MTLERLNPDITVTAFTDKIVAENVDELVGDADIILDCMDNFPTRYLLNESARRKNIPLVYAASGASTAGSRSSILLRRPACAASSRGTAEGGLSVIGATPAVIGSLQALETLKYLSARARRSRTSSSSGKGRPRTSKSTRSARTPTARPAGTARSRPQKPLYMVARRASPERWCPFFSSCVIMRMLLPLIQP